MSQVSPHPIVLAEDDAASRKLLVRQLESAGYAVTACEDGRRALDAICRIGSCIVVADWMMPEMDGTTLCREVRQLQAVRGLGTVYFIMLTAQTERDSVVAGLDAGADDYLTKPYHRSELLARINAGRRIYDLQQGMLAREQELARKNAELEILSQKLERLANTDGLTGLTNRRHLLERLDEAWSMSVRRDLPLACILFDIDRFKRINDTHGHAAGDAVLKAVAAACDAQVRPYDLIGRFGGEEFIVVAPDTDAAGAAALAERLRAAVEAAEIAFEGRSIPVTMSLGVAVRGPQHADPAAAIAAADEMLYKAKENGRNQVWLCDADGQGAALAREGLARAALVAV